jgi:DNA-binding PadR family transcriptional regulator
MSDPFPDHLHGRGRHRGRTAPGFGPFPRGGPFPFGRFPFGRAPKARRGDVRAAALLLLAESPRNGYQLMQEIEQRSGGLWRPSPGSMYPVLQQLEDEGLVHPVGDEGRRAFELTAAGREHVEAHREELGSPWSDVADAAGETAVDFHSAMVQTVVAARQLAQFGSPSQVAAAQDLLVQTRRRLYRILADEDDAAQTAAQ